MLQRIKLYLGPGRKRIAVLLFGLGVLTCVSTGYADSFVATGSMATPRRYHTATLLPNGKVLVAGGNSGSGDLASVEIYDSVARQWSLAHAMNYARRSHTATLLRDGTVLVAGGITGVTNLVFQAEVYNPVQNTWSVVGNLSVGRADHTATLLANGNVLVAGGYPWSYWPGQRPLRPAPRPPPTCTTELYSPVTRVWTTTGSLNTCRYAHVAALLPNGQVLVAGGCDTSTYPYTYISSAEVYTPASGSWGLAQPMSAGRAYARAVSLPNGDVLVVGGSNGTLLNTSEYFQQLSGLWQTPVLMFASRYLSAAALLPNGLAAVFGGYDGANVLATADIYNPAADTWTATSATMTQPRQDHTAIPLTDGTVLIAGGYNSGAGVLATAELYQPGWGGMGYLGDGVVPPDPGGAAGPNGILQTVNTRLAYFNKDGTRRNGAWAADIPLDSFFGGGLHLIEDPKVIFDVAAGSGGRFYIVMEETSDPCYTPPALSHLHVAVSKTSDPADATAANSWYFYTFDMLESGYYAGDYPGVGIDWQALYVAYNMFPDASPYCWKPQPCSGSVRGATAHVCQIIILNKSELASGIRPTPIQVYTQPSNSAGLNDHAFTLQPVTPADGGAGHDWVFFVESSSSDWDPSGTHARLWYIDHPLATPTPSQIYSAATPSFVNSTGGGQNCGTGAPQPVPDPQNPSAVLSTVEGNRTLGNAISIGNDIWFCSTEGGPSRALATWYHLDVTDFPTTVNASSGQIDPGNGVWTFYPTLTANANGDVCMVFSQSSSALNPSIGYVWRLGSDPVSPPSAVFRPPQTLLVSPYVSYAVEGDTVERWGDFGSVSVDPQDGTFWLSHEMVPLSNLIPAGQTYNASGQFDLALQSNQGYTILWGANDTSVTLCGTQHNTTGAGTVTKVTTVNCGSPILHCVGSAGSAVTLRVTLAHDYGTWWNQVYVP